MCTGLDVSVRCPALELHLAADSSSSSATSAPVPLRLELQGVALDAAASGCSALRIQQLRVMLSQCDDGGTNAAGADGAANNISYTPVLQLPACVPDDNDDTQCQRAAAPSQSTPSLLGRIYDESLLSSYISHVKVCGWQPSTLNPKAYPSVPGGG